MIKEFKSVKSQSYENAIDKGIKSLEQRYLKDTGEIFKWLADQEKKSDEESYYMYMLITDNYMSFNKKLHRLRAVVAALIMVDVIIMVFIAYLLSR